MNYPDFRKKLIRARQQNGLTQLELAEKSKISLRTIQRIESGQANPRAYTLKQLSETMGLDFINSSEFSRDDDNRNNHSKFIWPKAIFWLFIDLFNLKTKTMRKVTILSSILCVTILGLFAITTESNAQIKDYKETSNFFETNGKGGIIYLIPKNKKTIISNSELVDTTSIKVDNDLIQEFKNKIYFNGELIGEADKGDTVKLDNDKLIITKLTLCEYDLAQIKVYIPCNYKIDNYSMDNDTTHIDFANNHIKYYQDKLYLNEIFIGKIKKGEKAIFKNNNLIIDNI